MFLQENEDPTARSYTEVSDISSLISKVEEYLVDHNSTSKQTMNLAVFLYAVEHISRVCRVLKQPGKPQNLHDKNHSRRMNYVFQMGFMPCVEKLQI